MIPTRDRPEHLEACLRSVRASLGPDDEVVVVDSASSDPLVSDVAHGYGAVYLRSEVPGASRARNIGWRSARHDVIAFVDDDVRVLPGWAPALGNTFATFPATAFVTGRLGLPPGTTWTDVPISTKEEVEPAVLEAETAGVLGHGANLAVRRQALQAVNGFDERLGAGGDFMAQEDNDLIDRLFATGLTGRYEPEAEGWHEQWRSRRELAPLNWAYGFGSGARIAKLIRTDRRRARGTATAVFWDWGMRDLVRWLPHFRFAAALAVVRVAGATVGLARTLPVRVVDGHFATPRVLRHAVG
ncbi:MAG: glycosyltransferase [Acidimicrobiales bacterium]